MNSNAEKLVRTPNLTKIKNTHQPIQTEWKHVTAKQLDQEILGCIDSIGLISGVANTIMQLAYPGVGHGVMESRVESGSILKHPFKRARTTLTYLSVAMQGTSEEKLAYRRAINHAHAQVTSTDASPIKYRALDSNLQLWVAACLFWGYMDVYEKFRGPMSYKDQQRFYELAKPLGTTLQVRQDMWPKDIDGFWDYWNNTLADIQLPDDVREWLMQLVDFTFLGPVFSKTLGSFATLMTTGFLHPRIREQINLPWGEKEQLQFSRNIKILRSVNNRMPRFARQLPGNLFLWDFRRRLRKGLPLN